MKIKDYGFRSRIWPEITEKYFRMLDSSYVCDIIDKKDKIIELLDAPTTSFDSKELGAITGVSVREKGLVFQLYLDSYDDREPEEFALVYFFQNGDIYYIPEALSSFNWGYQERDDDIIDELEEKMGFRYELLKEKMFIAELYEKTKPRNKKMMELVKNKINTILDNAKKERLEFESDEMVYMKRLNRELISLRKKQENEPLTREEAIKLQELDEIVCEYIYCHGGTLPEGFEWCRKAQYDVKVELGCYKIDKDHPLVEGFIEKEFEIDGKMEKYAIKEGFNELEKNSWSTNPNRKFIITGTVGERWPVSDLSAYDVNEEDVTIEPMVVSTKKPTEQEFLVAKRIPYNQKLTVISKWAYRKDGTIDESQVLVTNSKDSIIDHADGDYVVAKHIEGKPEYMELSEEERNTKEAATLYSPRIINGRVMLKTYDHALTKAEIKHKYKKKTLKL